MSKSIMLLTCYDKNDKNDIVAVSRGHNTTHSVFVMSRMQLKCKKQFIMGGFGF